MKTKNRTVLAASMVLFIAACAAATANVVDSKEETANIVCKQIIFHTAFTEGTISKITSFPVWSADDSRLAFLTNRDGLEGSFAIYAVNADGSGLQALTEPIFSVSSFFSWSPDGNSVAVFTDGAIYVMDLNSSEMTNLFTVDYPNYVSNFSWQP